MIADDRTSPAESVIPIVTADSGQLLNRLELLQRGTSKLLTRFFFDAFLEG